MAESDVTARRINSLVRAQGSTFFVVLAILLLLSLGLVAAGCVKLQDLSSPEKTVEEWHAAMEAKNVGRMQNCIALSSRQVLNVDFQEIDTIRVVSLDVKVLSQTDTDALVHVVADIETTNSSGEVTTDHSDSRWNLIKKGSEWLVTSFQV